MFAWDAETTYYQDLLTGNLSAPIADNGDNGAKRPSGTQPSTTPPPAAPPGTYIPSKVECPFTSFNFRASAVRQSLDDLTKPSGSILDPPEPSFDWVNNNADPANGITQKGKFCWCICNNVVH